MKQEELRKRLRKIEKDKMNMFSFEMPDTERRQWSLVHDFDEVAAEAELEKLNAAKNVATNGISAQIGDKTITYNEQIVMYQKISKIFWDLAKVQKKKFYNQLDIKKEGEILFYMSEQMRVLMEETLNTAYEWIQKLGITDFSREDMQTQYYKRVKADYEVLAAPFLKIVEMRVLAYFKKDEEAVLLDDESCRTDLYNPMILHSMTSAVCDLGAFKNQAEYMKLLDHIVKSERMIDKYANFIFEQTIGIGKYVVELLNENNKIPSIAHNYDVLMIYKTYLLKFLREEILDDDYSDILWTLLGESLDNEMILTGILNFEAIHDVNKRTELYQWLEKQGCYLKDTSNNNIYYYSEMGDDDFIDHYNAALYSAQNEIELQYYIQRYRGWYLNTEEGETEKNDTDGNEEYACEYFNTQIRSKIQKLNNVESKVYEDYGKIVELKTHTDNYLKEKKWFEAIELVDGRCGYVEWAIFNVIDEQIKYNYNAIEEQKKFNKGLSSKVNYIGRLLSRAQYILDEIDRSVGVVINNANEQGDVVKTVALNVLRAACHYCFIQMEHYVLNMPDGQIEKEDLKLYDHWKSTYKMQKEKKSFQMMKQCETVIIQGANKGSALACILLLENRIPINMNQQQKETMYQVTMQKYCPIQMLRIGEKLLTDVSNESKILKAYYCYLMVQKLTGEYGQIADEIQKIQTIVCG